MPPGHQYWVSTSLGRIPRAAPLAARILKYRLMDASYCSLKQS